MHVGPRPDLTVVSDTIGSFEVCPILKLDFAKILDVYAKNIVA